MQFFVVCGCAVSRRYVYVCYCDMFSVVNVYLDHLKFCLVCVYGRRYVCCGEFYVVSNECYEPTSCHVQHIVAHCCKVMYFGCCDFRGELGFLNCDDVCMCVGISSLSSSSLFMSPFMLNCSVMRFLSLLLLGLCACVVFVVLWYLWSVCEVVVVPYVVGAVVAVTVMHVLLFVLHV